MIDNFDDWKKGRKARRLRGRVRKGVPDCVRGKVWQMMVGSMVSVFCGLTPTKYPRDDKHVAMREVFDGKMFAR